MLEDEECLDPQAEDLEARTGRAYIVSTLFFLSLVMGGCWELGVGLEDKRM